MGWTAWWTATCRRSDGRRFEALFNRRGSEAKQVGQRLRAAGAAARADVRIDPINFELFAEEDGELAEPEAVWLAALLVHEAAHVRQPGECSAAYAATQDMTLEEYALYLETGPGQAYAQELAFWKALRDLRAADGRIWIEDGALRAMIERQITVLTATLGRDRFPNGELVPTCAGG